MSGHGMPVQAKKAPDPGPLLEAATGFMRAKHALLRRGAECECAASGSGGVRAWGGPVSRGLLDERGAHSAAVRGVNGGEFLINTGDGDVYSLDEGKEWLARTAWRVLEHTSLAGPASVLVAEAE